MRRTIAFVHRCTGVAGAFTDGSFAGPNAAASQFKIDRADIAAAAARLGASVRSLDLMQREDAYYYGHKRPVALPAYRLVLDDLGYTRLYIDPATGAVQTLDLNAQRTRSWESALHKLGLPGLRACCLWDLVVLLWRAGVTAVTLTGTWLAWRVLRRRGKQATREANIPAQVIGG